jgi:sugar phosphate isomerase/epimerase
VHPRVSVHQVAFLRESTTAFVDHCRTLGVEHLTLVTPLLIQPGGVQEAQQAIADGGPRVTSLNHPFATSPHLAGDEGAATAKLLQAIEIGAKLGATNIYLLTGGRGSLTWEQAAQRFAELIAPCKAAAARAGVTLLIENASAFNADIHIAHTLADTLTLADIAGTGICLELHACWMEAGLQNLIRRAMPRIGLVQVSDYVLGDRTAPCRAVPGDGAIPLKRILGDVLDAGYQGVFDLELVGPRIDAEGARAATTRGALRLSELLTALGG